MGGDEFVVLLDEIGEPRQIEHHAHRLADSIEQAVHVGGLNLVISAALGGAMFPAHADTIAGVLAMADKAMYRAKRLGDRKSTRLTSSHYCAARMPSSA